MGGKLIEISTDENTSLLNLNQPIVGEDPLDVQSLAESFGDTAVSLTETSQAISSIIAELKQISKTSKRLLDRIEERVIEGNLFKVF